MFTLGIIFVVFLVAFGLWTSWPRKKRRSHDEAGRRDGTDLSATDGFILGSGATTFSGMGESGDTSAAHESYAEAGSDSGWGDFGGGGSGGDFGGDSGGGDSGGGGDGGGGE